MDMILCFYTAFYVDERLEYSLRVIRVRYLTTWFTPDLLSTVPIDKIGALLLKNSSAGSADGLASLQLIRVLRLARLFKLLRLMKLSNKSSAVDMNKYVNPAIRRLLSVLGKIMFVAHLLSCMWFGVNSCVPSSKIEVGMDIDQPWSACGNHTVVSQYLASFYWVIATMMAVGYGDVSPQETSEQIFGIFTQVVGAMAFGLIIATVGIIVETLDPEVTARKRKMDELKSFLVERRITKQLQRQVKEHYEYYYTRLSVFPEQSLFADLPNSLLIKLVYEVRKEELSVIKLFNRLETMCVVEIVNKLKPFQLNYMQTLGGFGAVSREMYFVVKGKVEALCLADCGMAVCGIFKDGDDLEIDSVMGEQVMRATYRALHVTDLMWLDCEDLLDSIEEYPDGQELVLNYKKKYDENMTKCITSETITDHPKGGMVKSLVFFDCRARNVHTLEDEFSEGHDEAASSKIRTYRKVHLPPQSRNSNGRRRSFVGGSPSPVGRERLSSTGTPTTPTARSAAPNTPTPPTTPHTPTTPTTPVTANTPGGLSDTDSSRGKFGSFRPSLNLGGKVVIEEAEETTADLLKRWIINPKHGKKVAWDLYIGVLIIWSVIVVPYRLGFNQEPEGAMNTIDILQDIMFGVDILLCFRVAFLDDHLVYVTEPKMIAKNYLTGWFLIDFLSTFPTDRLIAALSDVPDTNIIGDGAISDKMGNAVDFNETLYNATLAADMAAKNAASEQARSLKMIKVLRLIRLSKLARLFKLKGLVKGMDDILAISAVAMKFLQLIISLIFVGHLFGCFWNYVSMNASDPQDVEAGNVWYKNPYVDLDEGDVGGQYIASLYWAFTTMTTVGYGDVTPQNDAERIYCTMIMVMGATIFGYIVGSVGALAINVNGAPARTHSRVSNAMNYLNEDAMLPKRFKEMVRKQISFLLKCKSPFDEAGMLATLPRELRREVILQCHRDVIPSIPLFKRQSREFISNIVQKMRPYFVLAGETIIEENTASDGFYFLTSGTAVTVATKDKTQPDGVYIDPGRFFGHDIYLTGQNISPVGFKAVSDCTFYVLLTIDVSALMDTCRSLSLQLRQAIHSMIRGQPQIKTFQKRARKQRRSIQQFSFGTKKKSAVSFDSGDSTGASDIVPKIIGKKNEDVRNQLFHSAFNNQTASIFADSKVVTAG